MKSIDRIPVFGAAASREPLTLMVPLVWLAAHEAQQPQLVKIAELAALAKLPAIYQSKEHVEAGGASKLWGRPSFFDQKSRYLRRQNNERSETI